MRPSPGNDDYRWNASPEDAWRLLVEPMDRDEAALAAQAITRALPHVRAYPADPRTELVAAWHRWTVELMRDGLMALEGTGREVPRQIIEGLDRWPALAEPAEAAAVPLVEEILESAASRHSFEPRQATDGRHLATHVGWICACVTTQEAPTWLIYDDAEGNGVDGDAAVVETLTRRIRES